MSEDKKTETATQKKETPPPKPNDKKMDASKQRPPVAILKVMESQDKDSFLSLVEEMTGDKEFTKKFAACVRAAVQKAWKFDKVSKTWINDFNLVPVSEIVNCLYECARRKVLPDGYNAYLVIYKGKNPTVKLLVDYKGLIDVAIAEGIVLDCNAKEVRENDEIEIDFGEVTSFKIDAHKKRGEIIGCVAWAILPNNRRKSVYLDLDELQQIRDCAQTEEVWGSWEIEMYKKSAIRRLFKTTRNSPRLTSLMDVDNDAFELERRVPTMRETPRGSSVRMLDGSHAVAELPPPEEVEEVEETQAENAPVPELVPVSRDNEDHAAEQMVFQ